MAELSVVKREPLPEPGEGTGGLSVVKREPLSVVQPKSATQPTPAWSQRFGIVNPMIGTMADTMQQAAQTIGRNIAGAPRAALHQFFSQEPDIVTQPQVTTSNRGDGRTLASGVSSGWESPEEMAAARQQKIEGLPLVGPIAGAAMRGQPGEALGEAATLAAAGAGPSLQPSLTRAVTRPYHALTDLNLPRAINEALPTPAADVNFPEVAPTAFSDVRQFGGQTGKTVNAGNLALRKEGGTAATTRAIQTLQEGLEPWILRAEKARIPMSGDAIVRATVKAIPELMWTTDPAAARAIVQEAQQSFGGRQFSADQFRDFLKTENGTLAGFYNRAPGAQNAIVASGRGPAIEQAQANAFRDELYNRLDPEHNGAGPREIQQRTGDLIHLRNAATANVKKIEAEKPKTVLGGIGKIAKGTAQMFHRSLGEPAAGVLHPWMGPSDATIGKIYQQAPEAAALPRPSDIYYPKPATAYDVTRQLPSPTFKMPGPMEGTGSSYNPNAYYDIRRSGETRPAGATPDIRPRALLPPASNMPPLMQDLGGIGGDVTRPPLQPPMRPIVPPVSATPPIRALTETGEAAPAYPLVPPEELENPLIKQMRKPAPTYVKRKKK